MWKTSKDRHKRYERTYLDVPVDSPAARNVTVDAINLKTPSCVFVYLVFRARGPHVDVEINRQTLIKIALGGIQHVLAYVHDITKEAPWFDGGFLVWDRLAKIDVIGACNF